MAFVTVGATTIPIAQGSGAIEIVETGERLTMFDGSMLDAVRARKQSIALQTPYVTRTLAETYKAALLATPPLSCAGDVFNGVATDCFAKYQGMQPIGVPGGQKWRVLFTLYEA